MAKFTDPGKAMKYVNKSILDGIKDGLKTSTTKILEKSPFRTGRFRANWWGNIDSPIKSMVGIVDSTSFHSDTFSKNLFNAVYRQTNIKAIHTAIDNLTFNNVFYLSNNVPYARRLADGWSKSAPAGWVESILKDTDKDIMLSIRRLDI